MSSIAELEKQARSISKNNAFNYTYEYYKKTPNGMLKDTEFNHEYGDTRKGFEKWKEDNDNLYANVAKTSIREIINRTTGSLIGFVFETKESHESWIFEVHELIDKAFEIFCADLEVKDKEAVEMYLFDNVGISFHRHETLFQKFNIMQTTYEKYNDPDEESFRKVFDKIKN